MPTPPNQDEEEEEPAVRNRSKEPEGTPKRNLRSREEQVYTTVMAHPIKESTKVKSACARLGED